MSERIIPYKEPEVVLKKRKNKQKSLDKSIANDIKNKIKTKSKSRGKVYKRAEKFVKEYLSKEKFEVQISRRAKRANVYEIPNAPTLIFAIRISTPLESHSKVADVLNLLRLNSFNTGVFLKLNKTTLHLLKLVEPYVTWGTPSLNSIRQMIMKRGHIKTEKGHLPLTDNKLVEDALGEHNIICIEDIIHEIATLGPHFKDVNALIWHVKLNPPTKGWKKSVRPFGKGGDFGSRGDKINSLLQTMI